jgi:hypothetical protein
VYDSSLHGTASIFLHRCAGEATVEFLSRGNETSEHGSWGIDAQGFMHVRFNCQEGVSRPHGGGSWVLHPTTLWRDPSDSSGANWEGADDKGAAITMVWRRSLQITTQPGSRRPKTALIEAL